MSFFSECFDTITFTDDELDEYLSGSRKAGPEVSDTAPKLSLSNDDWLDE